MRKMHEGEKRTSQEVDSLIAGEIDNYAITTARKRVPLRYLEDRLDDPDDPCDWLLNHVYRLLPDESQSPVNRYRGFMFARRVSEAFDGATLSPVCATCDTAFPRDRDFCEACGTARRLVTKQFRGIDAQYVNGWVQYWVKNNGPFDPDFNVNTINASVTRIAFHAWRLAGRPEQLGNDVSGHEEEVRTLGDLFALSQALRDLSLKEA